MIRISSLIILAFLLSAGACKEKRQHPVQGMSNDEMRELLIESSKYHAQREDGVIETYIEGLEVDVQKTGTGLRYHIYSDRDSACRTIKTENTVRLDYRVELLDSTLCYSSEKSGPRSFVVDHDDVESGLHEGAKLLCEGDSALLIMPSFLAHGLTGDQQKIPSNSPIVYRVKIRSVK